MSAYDHLADGNRDVLGHMSAYDHLADGNRDVFPHMPAYEPALGVVGYGAMPTYLISRYSSIPSKPPSRPKPECLTPPKGAAGLDTMPWLMPTMPNSSASLTRRVRARSRVKT